MTEIRWKNGGPLFLQPAPGSPIGLVAADQDCCCPPPPPDRCWCGSTCSYFIELVEPSALAVRTLSVECPGSNARRVVTTSSLLQEIVPVQQGDTGDFTFPASYSQSIADNTSLGQLYVAAQDVIHGFPTFLPPELYYFQLRGASRNASVSVFCAIDSGTQQPKYYARIILSARARYVFESLGFTPLGYWVRVYEGVFELPATCVVSPTRECVTSGQEFLRITTPVEITLSGDGTCSLGNLTMQADSGGDGVPPSFPYARDAVDAILDATSYTFRITSRDTCEPEVDCDCASITHDLTIVFNFRGTREFIWNDEEQFQSDSDLGAFYSFSYSPQGPGNEARVVIQQWNLSVTEMYYQWTMDIFCEAIPSGIPSPYRWYGSQLLECFEWDSGTVVKWTQQTLLGHFNCQADPCGTNGRSLGDLYPAGAWRDVEYFDRVTPEGYVTCNPAGPIDFEIRNDAECP